MAKLFCHIMGPVQSFETGVLIDGLKQQYEVIIDDYMVTRTETENIGQINAKIVATDEERAAYLVELPRQVTMGGRAIWVPKSAVVTTE